MTVIFSATLDGFSDFSGYTIRSVVDVTGNSEGGVRVTFKAEFNGALCDHAAIGIWNGTAADTTTTPVELKFGGASGFVLGGNGSITSDWANLAFTTGNKLVVIVDAGVFASDWRYKTAGSLVYLKDAADSYNVSDFTETGTDTVGPFGFDTIETQGGVTVSRSMSMGGSG